MGTSAVVYVYLLSGLQSWLRGGLEGFASASPRAFMSVTEAL